MIEFEVTLSNAFEITITTIIGITSGLLITRPAFADIVNKIGE